MKSRAHIKSHPLHPILVGFPIAFFTGTLVFDALGILYDRNDFHAMAGYLQMAGIGSGLLAAIPGIIDYLHTVPPKSSAKKRASQHGLLNTTHIVLFSIALYLRENDTVSLAWVIALEVMGFALMGIAGWMGGTLVYRNQIGVDVRYADAGKWKEAWFDKSDAPIEVAEINELNQNQMKLLHIEGKRIVLCRTDNGYAAFDDACTHKGASLAGGSMVCGTVQCPWHGSQFDVVSGTVKAGPAQQRIPTYKVSEVSGKILLHLK